MNQVRANRLLLICAISCLLVAAVVALRVIPAVQSDASPNAGPERAVPAFWVNAGLSLLLSVSCGAVALRSKGRGWGSTTILVLVGIVALLLGFALLDAAAAFRSHEMLARGTAGILFICAAVDLLVGISVILVSCRRPSR